MVDCKTVRIFAYSSTREQSDKRSGMRLKTESETGERPYGRVRLARFARVRLLRHALLISLLILRKKPTVLQSSKMAAENSLFELEAVEVPPVNKTACRKRKPNFSIQETAMITQTFEENQAVLT